jgi:hypothetical protein
MTAAESKKEAPCAGAPCNRGFRRSPLSWPDVYDSKSDPTGIGEMRRWSELPRSGSAETMIGCVAVCDCAILLASADGLLDYGRRQNSDIPAGPVPS